MLEFFPRRVSAESEATGAFDASSLEHFGFACHAQRLLGLGLKLAGLEHPFTVLFLLFCEDLSIASRDSLGLGRPSEVC